MKIKKNWKKIEKKKKIKKVFFFSVKQTPYFWPSNCWEPENTDYAVYLCKRTMQNKARLELADYEAENLARLQKMFSRKWEFIFMQAEAQSRVDKKRDKLERKVLDSQERAFWDVHRPVVTFDLCWYWLITRAIFFLDFFLT